MKTLNNHLILFDAECPMCKVYTKAFVSAGLLTNEGRAAYQDLGPQACPLLDRQRAANEIALVNQETGEVTYGIASLFKVFSAALPILKPLFEFKPFIWLMSRVYAFIAYNRRVIVPSNGRKDAQQLQPEFRLNYRIAYLLLTWIVAACILSAYARQMNGLLPPDHTYREYLVCGGQLIFQGLLVNILYPGKTWNYLGNMMTVSFAGALLLLPGLLLSYWLSLNPVFYAVYFMAVAGLMLLEHVRRVGLLQMSWMISAGWVLYRVLVLLAILIIK